MTPTDESGGAVGARLRAEAIDALREAMPHIERAREAVGEWITSLALGDPGGRIGSDLGMGIDSDLFRAQLRFQKLEQAFGAPEDTHP